MHQSRLNHASITPRSCPDHAASGTRQSFAKNEESISTTYTEYLQNAVEIAFDIIILRRLQGCKGSGAAPLACSL
jgi:hypothetical protein